MRLQPNLKKPEHEQQIHQVKQNHLSKKKKKQNQNSSTTTTNGNGNLRSSAKATQQHCNSHTQSSRRRDQRFPCVDQRLATPQRRDRDKNLRQHHGISVLSLFLYLISALSLTESSVLYLFFFYLISALPCPCDYFFVF